MPLARWIDGSALGTGMLNIFLSIVLLSLNALMLIRIGIRNMLYEIKVFLPAVIYVMVACGIYIVSHSLSLSLASFLTTWAFSEFTFGYRRFESFSQCFNGALLLGTAFLLCPTYAVTIVAMPLVLATFRRSVNEQIVALFGALLPFMLSSYIYWGAGESITHMAELTWKQLSAENVADILVSERLATLRMAALAVIGIITFISIIKFVAVSGNIRARASRVYLSTIYLTAASVLALLLPCAGVEILSLAAIPLSLLIPLFFTRFRRHVATIIYIIMVGGVIALNVVELVAG